MITGSWVRDGRVAGARLLPRRLRSLHILVLVLVLAVVAWLGWTWYRNSSFVKVERVSVVGLNGPAVPQIRHALASAALGMTTLDVQISKLEASVEQYPYVRTLTVTRQGAHMLVIHVSEEVPVAVGSIGGNRQLIDGEGRVLPDTGSANVELPLVPIVSAPAGPTITAAGPRAAIAVLAAAPYAFLSHIENATSSSAHGVIVQLRGGPQLYFGPAVQLHQKWAAVVAVLRVRDSAGASYIDVSDPQRPAAGSGVTEKAATDLGLLPSTSSAAQTTTGQATSHGP